MSHATDLAAQLCAVPDLFAFLAGRWRIARRLDDRRLGLAGSFAGTAVFAATADGLDYRETGTLAFGEHRGPAWRRLVFRRIAATRADVRFDDGRPFHTLDLSTGADAVVHPCGADLYRGQFTVSAPGAWRSVWTVAGPRKDQVIVTDYVRA